MQRKRKSYNKIEDNFKSWIIKQAWEVSIPIYPRLPLTNAYAHVWIDPLRISLLKYTVFYNYLGNFVLEENSFILETDNKQMNFNDIPEI